MRTWPARQPDARISLDDGWKAMHQGVRGWPVKTCRHFPVCRSVTRTLWSPWVEATLVLKKIQSNIKLVRSEYTLEEPKWFSTCKIEWLSQIKDFSIIRNAVHFMLYSPIWTESHQKCGSALARQLTCLQYTEKHLIIYYSINYYH